MPDQVQFKLHGIEAVLTKFDRLSKEARYKSGRSALRSAANLIMRKAKENAKTIDDPITSEEIAKNVAVRWSSRDYKINGDLKFRVGILGGALSKTRDALRAMKKRAQRGIASLGALGEIAGKGKKNPGGDTFYWRYQEFGTSKMRAQPFLRRSLSENIDEATSEFIKKFDKGIDKALRGK